MKIRKPYEKHERFQISFPNVSLTKQAMKSDTDINNIMAKYAKTGLMTHLAKHEGKYGDFSGVVDYHTALNSMIEADTAFASLPSKIREEFDNDAGKFMEFVHDPENLDQMVEMGLAHAPEAPTPVEVTNHPGEKEKPSGDDKASATA